jgi:hypothetical protein
MAVPLTPLGASLGSTAPAPAASRLALAVRALLAATLGSVLAGSLLVLGAPLWLSVALGLGAAARRATRARRPRR